MHYEIAADNAPVRRGAGGAITINGAQVSLNEGCE
jgi:hypothetical protein